MAGNDIPFLSCRPIPFCSHCLELLDHTLDGLHLLIRFTFVSWSLLYSQLFLLSTGVAMAADGGGEGWGIGAGLAEWLRHKKGEKEGEPELSVERYEELRNCEQFILTVCANGYGKLSSAYEYRRTGRGGQGITNIDNIARNGPVVASFPATQADQLMLVTGQAKLIRMGLDSLRVIGRNSAGVRLFNVAEDEQFAILEEVLA